MFKRLHRGKINKKNTGEVKGEGGGEEVEGGGGGPLSLRDGDA